MGNQKSVASACAPLSDSAQFGLFKKALDKMVNDACEQDPIDCFKPGPRKKEATIPQTQEFVLAACTSALLCDIIYREDADIEAELQEQNRQYPTWFRCIGYQLSSPRNTAKFGLFKFEGGKSYMVVRGSIGKLSEADWKDNLDHQAYEFLSEPEFVHKGLLSRSELVPFQMLSSTIGQDDLVLAGHSQGGAAVVLKVAAHKANNVVFSFGQPCCFYRAIPARFAPLRRHLATGVHRFYMTRDPVPVATVKLTGLGKFPEHTLNAETLDSSPPAHEDLDINRHDMRLYMNTLLNLAAVGSGTNAGINSCSLVQKSEYKPDILDLQTEFTGFVSERLVLRLRGIGYNTEWTMANLLDKDRNEFPGVKLQTGSLRSHPASAAACAKWGVKENQQGSLLSFEVSFDLTDAKFNTTNVSFWACNGFHISTEDFRLKLNNVVFVGKPGAGKSHLVRALKAYAESKPYPDMQEKDTVFKSGLPDCEEFTHGKLTFYEFPGIAKLNAQDHAEMAEALAKFPPRAVVFVWRADDVDDGDFVKVVNYVQKKIQALENPQDVQTYLAMTHCTFLREKPDMYERYLNSAVTGFGLTARTRTFKINSAHPLNDKGSIAGVAELFKTVKGACDATIPLHRSINAGKHWHEALRDLALGQCFPFLSSS